jgi:8-oxo-dGTP pyrophosphatase MutT (NUDIX family)
MTFKDSKDSAYLYCNNCGKKGHTFNQCKIPITSLGIVAFRQVPLTHTIEYLMISRKDTLGFIDFMRGKYSITDTEYIMNMFKQMTNTEKERIQNHDFYTLWNELWGNSTSTHYNAEEILSRDKFNKLRESGMLNTIVFESKSKHIEWREPEWGFPKGRRDFSNEPDTECAVREFTEETGYPLHILQHIYNLFPFEENFMGSNYKSYKHKYYICYIDYDDSIQWQGSVQREEVSTMSWKPFEQCLADIRSYNTEKINMLTHIHNCLTRYNLCRVV